MRSALEKLCERHGLLHRYQGEALCVIASCHYPEASHVVKITPTQNGKIGVFIQFPVETADIADVEEFCSELQSTFASDAELSFSKEEKCFFLYDVVEPDRLGDCIERLAHDCDIAKPLLESVGRQGYCHWQGIALARVLPTQLGCIQ